MKLTCNICGKEIKINPLDQEYERNINDKNAVFICENCQKKVAYQALKDKDEAI